MLEVYKEVSYSINLSRKKSNKKMNLLILRNFFLYLLLILISIIDSKKYKIPDGFIGALIGNWLFPLFLCDNFLLKTAKGLFSGGLIAGMVLMIAVFFDRMLKRKSLGGGDIKLIFAVSLYLGMELSLYMIFYACISGILVYIFRGAVKGEKKIPFGPEIALSTIFLIRFSYLFH